MRRQEENVAAKSPDGILKKRMLSGREGPTA